MKKFIVVLMLILSSFAFAGFFKDLVNGIVDGVVNGSSSTSNSSRYLLMAIDGPAYWTFENSAGELVGFTDGGSVTFIMVSKERSDGNIDSKAAKIYKINNDGTPNGKFRQALNQSPRFSFFPSGFFNYEVVPSSVEEIEKVKREIEAKHNVRFIDYRWEYVRDKNEFISLYDRESYLEYMRGVGH